MDKIRIGVSKCLLGQPVRYDGRHMRDPFIADTLGRCFDCVGVCPEAECGFGIPREPVRLAGDPANPRLVGTRSGKDRTGRMQAWVARRLARLEREGLHGFIFKARSPSCGMESVAVRGARGGIAGKAPGLFAKAFMAHFPLLPCEDEDRLTDPARRKKFIARVLALWRFRRAAGAQPLPRTPAERRSPALAACRASIFEFSAAADLLW